MANRTSPHRGGRVPLPGGTAILHIKIPIPQSDRLAQIAALTGESKSAIVRKALDKHFAFILSRIVDDRSKMLPNETEGAA